jgi:hypothetical protein
MILSMITLQFTFFLLLPWHARLCLMILRHGSLPRLQMRDTSFARVGGRLSILAGDNGDPTDGGDTIASPPRVRDDGKSSMASWDDGECLMALFATGPRTTPPHLAVVIEGASVVLGRLQ